MKYFSASFIYVLLIFSMPLMAQSLVEDANLSSSTEGRENVFTETIKIISASKKIFIITNNNQQLGPGDFISFALNENLTARAVVAKTHQGQVGVKILKIYSLNQWGKLRREMEVQVVKGDDSYFGKKSEKIDESKNGKIKTEDDLYSGDVVVEDDVGILDENKNRHIKPDNVVALTGAFYYAAAIESRGDTVRGNEFGVSWAYQFSDNYFIEGLYGRTLLDNYPGEQAQTLVNHVTGRLKYNIKGPLYTFFMPYLGFHSYTISSPQAGESGNAVQDQEELDAIEKLKKSGPVFGITIMRRLVPGWFIKGDIGSDIMNVGFAIEF